MKMEKQVGSGMNGQSCAKEITNQAISRCKPILFHHNEMIFQLCAQPNRLPPAAKIDTTNSSALDMFGKLRLMVIEIQIFGYRNIVICSWIRFNCIPSISFPEPNIHDAKK
jgi:hypothetical protein